MILLSISTLFIPIRLHLLQYITLGSRIQYKWTKAVISQVFSRQQLCDLISVLWLDQCHMCWHLAWRLSTWGTRVEVGAWRVPTLETMEMTAINNSRSPHLWLLSSSQTPMAPIPTLTSSPAPQTGDCGSPGRPTTHQSWFFHNGLQRMRGKDIIITTMSLPQYLSLQRLKSPDVVPVLHLRNQLWVPTGIGSKSECEGLWSSSRNGLPLPAFCCLALHSSNQLFKRLK